jgi:Mg/Co/Ni transporter MgtE
LENTLTPINPAQASIPLVETLLYMIWFMLFVLVATSRMLAAAGNSLKFKK